MPGYRSRTLEAVDAGETMGPEGVRPHRMNLSNTAKEWERASNQFGVLQVRRSKSPSMLSGGGLPAL